MYRWIVQEVGLGRRLKIHCGLQRVDWRALHYLHQHLDSFSKFGLSFSQALLLKQSLAFRIDQHKMDHESNGTKLRQLLESCKDCQCSDPRDKVYALLGFADDCNAENLVIDYSKSLFGVFSDVVRFLFSPDQILYPRDSIRLVQDLEKIFGSRAEMDRNMEEARSEISMSPELFILAHGTFGGRVQKVSRRFNKADVSTALCAGGILVDVDQLTTTKSPGMAMTHSVAIKGTVAPQSPNRVFKSSYACTWHLSDELEFFVFEALLIYPYERREEFVGLTSAKLERDDIVCQFLGSDVAAIIRCSSSDSTYYSVIGRALLFQKRDITKDLNDWSLGDWAAQLRLKRDDGITYHSSLEDWTAAIEQKRPIRPQFTDSRAGAGYYSLFLDMETLHRLTR